MTQFPTIPEGELPLSPPVTITQTSAKNLLKMALDAGDQMLVTPKNPLQSTTVWGLIVMLVSWGAGRLFPADMQQHYVAEVLQIIGFCAGLVAAFYGRYKATRPLGVGANVKQVTVKLMPVLLLLSLIGVGGCKSAVGITKLDEEQQLIMADDTYTTSLEAINAAIRGRYISIDFAKKNILPAQQGVSTALNDLKATVARDKGLPVDPSNKITNAVIDFSTAWQAFQDAYAKFIQYRQQAVAAGLSRSPLTPATQPIVPAVK